ncbi:BspA family leucine-rich repeat surface protein, partial [uncultured Ellagibacter sp.]|uniref:BspA family leucine-rich repeat surface protein n=1 Tax=uncultured Ellagibacter sp. TaxID=2137580 RepID=UPI00260DF1B2
MSASAKPTEKLFKSFLAAVLAISLCPLMPADKAQAEEAGDSGEPADAAQMSDEGLGGDADPTEGALAADNSDADPELAGGNDGTEDEGALDDSNVALQAANDSGTPIVNWTKCGTCQWMIDSSGCLIIKPANGESGSLENWDSRGWYPEDISPWRSHADKIVSAKVENGVIAKTTRGMFCKCSEVVSIDLSGLDTSEVADMRSMFSDCSSLVSLDLSSLDTSSVTDMSGMFRDCSKLASLGLSSFDTSSVTSMYCMFEGCSSLASL